jgi:hypothetical protein
MIIVEATTVTKLIPGEKNLFIRLGTLSLHMLFLRHLFNVGMLGFAVTLKQWFSNVSLLPNHLNLLKSDFWAPEFLIQGICSLVMSLS